MANLWANFGLGRGRVDCAGSSVVHVVGGVAGLAAVLVLGSRIGKHNKDGSAQYYSRHNISMAVAGKLILAFGRFGFNPSQRCQVLTCALLCTGWGLYNNLHTTEIVD